MADENLDQRLAAIEAAIPSLATKADLEALRGELAGVAKNVDITALQQRVEQLGRNVDNHRSTLELRYQMLQLQLQPVALVTDRLDHIVTLLGNLVDRVVALEQP